jgi:hypothetical protein
MLGCLEPTLGVLPATIVAAMFLKAALVLVPQHRSATPWRMPLPTFASSSCARYST